MLDARSTPCTSTPYLGDGGKEETISPARHVEGGASCAAADVQHLHARAETETGTEILCRFFSTDAHIGAAKDGFVSQDSLPGVLVLIKMIKMVKIIKGEVKSFFFIPPLGQN